MAAYETKFIFVPNSMNFFQTRTQEILYTAFISKYNNDQMFSFEISHPEPRAEGH